MDKRTEIREGMAEKAHLVWQRWMAYMLTHLDEEHIERWKRQANTAYQDLPEHEKMSDRSIADEYSKYLDSQGAVIRIKCPDCQWSQFGGETVGMTPCYSCGSTGYIIESLIGE